MGLQIYNQSFYSKKYVKSEIWWYNFVRVWLKGAENNYEHHESWHAHLLSKCASKEMIKFNSEKFVKSETLLCGFAKVGVKGGENSSERHESWLYACLSNGNPNLWSNFNSDKLVRSETLSCIFARVVPKGGPNSSEHCKIWRACLYIKQASKSMNGKIAMNITKFGMHSYLTNGHLNLRSNFNSDKLVKSETSSCTFAKVGLKGTENSSKHH